MKASLPWTRPPNSPVPNTTAGETEGGAVGVALRFRRHDDRVTGTSRRGPTWRGCSTPRLS